VAYCGSPRACRTTKSGKHASPLRAAQVLTSGVTLRKCSRACSESSRFKSKHRILATSASTAPALLVPSRGHTVSVYSTEVLTPSNAVNLRCTDILDQDLNAETANVRKPQVTGPLLEALPLPPSHAQLAYDRLKQALREGRISGGSLLSESDLARQLA